jgi:DNA-binding CsgD family transcriptional regulator
LPIPSATEGSESKAARAQPPQRVPSAELLGLSGQKRLTKREREVLRLISEGYSNKQGALRMQISPRTFESHRAEAMRKLGARNTADLVRAALLHSID